MMTDSFKSNPIQLLQWQQTKATFYALTALFAWVLIGPMGMAFLELPVMPITIVGAAIGIFTSFRANQAYDRWWEGRKLWGRLINTSRHWSTQVLHYLAPEDRELAHELVLRHVSYVHGLRCLLRSQDPYHDEHFLRHLPEQDRELVGSTNLSHAMLHQQLGAVTELANTGRLDPLRLQSLDGTVLELLNIQGGCERIKGTPLPRGYGFIAEVLIQLFACMLPFAIVHDLGIMAVPLNVLVCLAFALISEAGRVLEDPWSMFFNGLPLQSLSTKIERNLCERLGHDELVAPTKESPEGVLM